MARSHVEVALGHRPVLIANALGSPPKDVIDQVHEAGVPVAARNISRQLRMPALGLRWRSTAAAF